MKNNLCGFGYDKIEDFNIGNILVPQYEIISAPQGNLHFSHFLYSQSQSSSIADVFMLKQDLTNKYSIIYFSAVSEEQRDMRECVQKYDPGNCLSDAFKIMKKINFSFFHNLYVFDGKRIVSSSVQKSMEERSEKRILKKISKRAKELPW